MIQTVGNANIKWIFLTWIKIAMVGWVAGFFFIKFAFLLNSLRQKVPFYSPGVFSVTFFSDFRRCSPLSDAVVDFVSYTKILFKFAQWSRVPDILYLSKMLRKPAMIWHNDIKQKKTILEFISSK